MPYFERQQIGIEQMFQQDCKTAICHKNKTYKAGNGLQ